MSIASRLHLDFNVGRFKWINSMSNQNAFLFFISAGIETISPAIAKTQRQNEQMKAENIAICMNSRQWGGSYGHKF